MHLLRLWMGQPSMVAARRHWRDFELATEKVRIFIKSDLEHI